MLAIYYPQLSNHEMKIGFVCFPSIKCSIIEYNNCLFIEFIIALFRFLEAAMGLNKYKHYTDSLKYKFHANGPFRATKKDSTKRVVTKNCAPKIEATKK